jgi:hypothetical protein
MHNDLAKVADLYLSVVQESATALGTTATVTSAASDGAEVQAEQPRSVQAEAAAALDRVRVQLEAAKVACSTSLEEAYRSLLLPVLVRELVLCIAAPENDTEDGGPEDEEPTE